MHEPFLFFYIFERKSINKQTSQTKFFVAQNSTNQQIQQSIFRLKLIDLIFQLTALTEVTKPTAHAHILRSSAWLVSMLTPVTGAWTRATGATAIGTARTEVTRATVRTSVSHLTSSAAKPTPLLDLPTMDTASW